MQGDQIQNIKGVISVLKLVIVFGHRSWKNDQRVMENHGKIMEFDYRKSLGTLHWWVCSIQCQVAFFMFYSTNAQQSCNKSYFARISPNHSQQERPPRADNRNSRLELRFI